MHLRYLNLNALNTQLNVMNGLSMGQFHQHIYEQLLPRSSQKRKNSVKLSVSFYAFWDLRA